MMKLPNIEEARQRGKGSTSKSKIQTDRGSYNKMESASLSMGLNFPTNNIIRDSFEK